MPSAVSLAREDQSLLSVRPGTLTTLLAIYAMSPLLAPTFMKTMVCLIAKLTMFKTLEIIALNVTNQLFQVSEEILFLTSRWNEVLGQGLP